MCKIRCVNNKSEYRALAGTTLLELLEQTALENNTPFIAAYVNNEMQPLTYKIYENLTVEFVDFTHFDGNRIYRRTLMFMLYIAVGELFPTATLKLQYHILRGSYFEISGGHSGEECAKLITEKIKEIANRNQPIETEKIPSDEARDVYERENLTDKIALLDSAPSLYQEVNFSGGVCNYFHGVMAPSTGYISLFSIEPFYDGFYILAPKRENVLETAKINQNKKVFEVMEQSSKLYDLLGVINVGTLNQMVAQGQGKLLIKLGESVQEHCFTQISNQIYQRVKEGVKLILISGPSSSGKTTFSNRLDIQLQIMGLSPVILSMDNYFVDRVNTPLDKDGKPDFEAVEAVDLELLNSHLAALAAGEEVMIPKYNFMSGSRCYDNTFLKLKENGVIIMEGIHALNPAITATIDNSQKFKAYVSPLTTISIDNGSIIDTIDYRLIRRIVRDSRYRNHTALQTLKGWHSVRRGEEKHIFPFQNSVDAMFNTALFFELSILKRYIEPLLIAIPDSEKEYSEARRLLKLLSLLVPIEDNYIPPTSILREFIGGSSFDY